LSANLNSLPKFFVHFFFPPKSQCLVSIRTVLYVGKNVSDSEEYCAIPVYCAFPVVRRNCTRFYGRSRTGKTKVSLLCERTPTMMALRSTPCRRRTPTPRHRQPRHTLGMRRVSRRGPIRPRGGALAPFLAWGELLQIG
jgi:hypothetical protein